MRTSIYFLFQILLESKINIQWDTLGLKDNFIFSDTSQSYIRYPATFDTFDLIKLSNLKFESIR